MDSYCRNCTCIFTKSFIEYYKIIMSHGFPLCINCKACVDCCQYECQCVRCNECFEVIDVCRCDNDPSQYSNYHNAFTSNNWNQSSDTMIFNDLINNLDGFTVNDTFNKLVQTSPVDSLINKFDGCSIKETPIPFNIYNDQMQ